MIRVWIYNPFHREEAEEGISSTVAAECRGSFSAFRFLDTYNILRREPDSYCH